MNLEQVDLTNPQLTRAILPLAYLHSATLTNTKGVGICRRRNCQRRIISHVTLVDGTL
ncbi:hypothetical protein [Coleofasciculus chthonoplastes]|uniref:hypothetical protein n=1 Tax=Coleofasciculus chthonoplastes TaxID=64178 RepID=UPI004064C372